MPTPLRLLLVEDDPDDAFLVQRQLRNAGFELSFHRVDSPESFASALQDRTWDVILSDYQMPGFSGFAALEILRKSGLDIPFMLVSGAIGEHIAVEAMRNGARDYLLKDNLARLAPAIQRELLESSERQARRKAEFRQKTLEGALQAILKGTSSEIGVGFFRSLVETLASSLQVKGALIAEYEKRSSVIRILAVHGFETPVPGQELSSSGTLAHGILSSGHVMMQNLDSALFVDGTPLRSMGIRSVIGLRLDSREGQPQGLLLVLDDKEIEEPDLTQDLISVFASRAGSELDRLDAERRRLSIEKQLLHSQKLEAVGTLAGGVAHDINNILTSIWGHAQLLEMRFSDGPGSDSIQGILKGCRRARDLARQILLFSRKQEPELHPVHLGEIVDETWKLLRATFPSSLRMKFDIEPNLPPVLGESSQLHQVLMNLCTNACHAMGSGGGTLAVSASRISDSSDRLEAVPQIELLVTDTGSGIPPEIMPRIFEPFFTTKGPGIGTGLGLSVVHGIIQNHKGSITVSSEPGKGTTFKILLPCLAQEFPPDVETHVETKTIKTDRFIMVVDDEDAVADVLYHLLAVLGYKSEVFMNPLMALEAFKEDPSKWAAIISDYTMPDLSGDQFVGEVRAIRSDIPFLLTSGYENHGQSDSIARLGISCFIPKPFQADDLARHLGHCLSASQA
jgi:signal transduction histidine kinase